MLQGRYAGAVAVLLVLGASAAVIGPGVKEDLPPVVVVSIDTMRADRVSAAGYDRNLTPHLDSFINDSYYFENAYANSHWTLPSHGVIMTGRYPSETGALNYDSRLCPEERTIASELRSQGYETAGFTADGGVSRMWNIDKGFDRWEESYWSLKDGSVPRAIKFLEENDRDSFFLFVHGYDTHAPYVVNRSELRYGQPSNSSVPATEKELREVMEEKNLDRRTDAFWNRYNHTDPDAGRLRNLYDNKVYQADSSFGRLIGKLKSENLYEESLIIVLSDHGEQLAQNKVDGEFLKSHHGFYPDTVRVLLAIKEPHQSEASNVEKRVSLVDLYPAILSVLSGDEGRGIPDSFEERQYVFMEDDEKRVLLGQDYRLVKRVGNETGDQESSYSLYSAENPYRKVDLKEERPEAFEDLKNRMSRYPGRNLSEYCESKFDPDF